MSWIREKFAFKPRYAGCLGAEEEYWTLHPQREELVSVSRDLFRKIKEGRFKPELPAQQIEAVTPVCRSPRALLKQIARNRKQGMVYGRRFGFRLGLDSMPPSQDFALEVYPKQRYLTIRSSVPEHILRNGWITGLHIHVGCEDIGDAIAKLNILREHMPLLAALSDRTGGERLRTYLNMCPQFVPPFIESETHFERLAHEQGFLEDPKRCWWGIRINPVGTVEVRLFDMQVEPAHVGDLAALLWTILDQAQTDPIHCSHTSEDVLKQMLEAARDSQAYLRQQRYRLGSLIARAYNRAHDAPEGDMLRALVARRCGLTAILSRESGYLPGTAWLPSEWVSCWTFEGWEETA